MIYYGDTYPSYAEKLTEFPILQQAFQWAISRTNLPSRKDMIDEEILENYEYIEGESDDEEIGEKVQAKISGNILVLS